MSDGQHEHIDYMHNHHHLFSDLENILKMKKDKALNKTGRLGSYHFQINETKTTSGETSIRIAFYPVLGELTFLQNFNRYSAKQLRKFIKALKKGLRRLERG